MAKALGLNPRKLAAKIPGKSQPWKAPVHIWIRDLYEKMQEKAARRRTIEQAAQPGCPNRPSDAPPSEPGLTDSPQYSPPEEFVRRGHGPVHETMPPNGNCQEPDDELGDVDDDFWTDNEPSDKDIKEQNLAMLRRQKELRAAAEYVADALARLPAVQRVVLIGSVAMPLTKEVPRFREYRRAGIAIWHECGDVDLAVWVTDLSNLKSLQKARSQALNDLLAKRSIGVAHHQVEVFLMEPGTDRYLGRLCCFGSCPKGKPDCLVSGCGATKFLKQHVRFRFQACALAPDRSIVMYEISPHGGGDSEAPIPF